MVKTRKSLWAAGFALLVCILLLIGTTFAWFTDSVSNSGNKIQAGTLDITLEELGSDGQFTAVGEEPIFDSQLWEPGYSECTVLKVANAGSLALKWRLDLTAYDDTGKPVDAGDLGNVIDVYAKVSEGQAITGKPASLNAAIDEGYKNVGTLNQLMADVDGVAYGKLYAEGNMPQGGYSEAYAGIILHMQENAGNEYQDASIGTTFDIVLNATQLAHEKDGFGNPDYDENAQYPEIHRVDANTDLSDLVNNPSVPVEITVTENMMNQGNEILSVTGNVTMNLGTNTINKYSSQITGTDITVGNGGKLTINAEANSGLKYTAGKLAADGSNSVITVNGGKYGDSGAGNSEVSARNGGTVYVNEGSFSTSGARGHAVTAEADSTIYINGGSFSTSGANSITIYANGGTIIIENLKSVTANGSRYGVDNGGKILVSKEYSPSAPTSLASGCSVTDNGDGYWLITKN